MKLTRRNIALELAVEQLRRIGFEGDPYAEVMEDGWTRRHSWPDRESEAKFREWAKLQMRLVCRWSKQQISREWGTFVMWYAIRSATGPTAGEVEAEALLADVDLDREADDL